jgi:hypothetical protein
MQKSEEVGITQNYQLESSTQRFTGLSPLSQLVWNFNGSPASRIDLRNRLDSLGNILFPYMDREVCLDHFLSVL